MLNVRLLFLLLGSVLLAQPALAQSDTARFLALFSAQKDDSLRHAVEDSPAIPRELAEKFIYKPMLQWFERLPKGRQDSLEVLKPVLNRWPGLQEVAIRAGSRIGFNKSGQLLLITGKWASDFLEETSFLLYYNTNMELKDVLLAKKEIMDVGIWGYAQTVFSQGRESIIAVEFGAFGLYPIVVVGMGSKLVHIPRLDFNDYEKPLPPEASLWLVHSHKAIRYHLDHSSFGFCEDSSWQLGFIGTYIDSTSNEMLVLEDYYKALPESKDFVPVGIGVGYKNNATKKDWLKLEVLNYSREAHQLTVRFPGDKTTYTLRLNPTHTACESQGSDGSAVQVFKAVLDK